MSIRELLIETTSPELDTHLARFSNFVCSKLGIEDRPPVLFVDTTGEASFGNYQPGIGTITVATSGRHIADILRTLAHEFVHDAQMAAGSQLSLEELEYEANAIAGMLMRDYNKENPQMYGAHTSETEPESESGGSIEDALPTYEPYPVTMAEDAVNAIGSGSFSGLGTGYDEPGFYQSDIDDPHPDFNHTQNHIRSLHGKIEKPKKNPHAEKHAETKARHLTLQQWKDDHEKLHLTELSNKTLASYKRKANAYVRFFKDKNTGRWYGRDALFNPHIGPKRERGIETAAKKLKARYAPITEDGAAGGVVSAGSGAIAGIGVGPQGEPGVYNTRKKRTPSPILVPMGRRKTLDQLKKQIQKVK